MTLEQMIEDTLAVTDFLREHFKQEKIYVMGHSWGSLLGVMAVQKVPELFHAYIGIGQVVRQAESERLAYAFMLEEFRAAENKGMVRKLEKYPIDQGAKIDSRYLAVRSLGMAKLGIGIMHHLRSMLKSVMSVLAYKGYSWKDKIHYPMGNSFSLNCLWDDVLQIDLCQTVPRLDVPVYIFHGKFDFQVSYTLAKEYSEVLESPIKGFYTFDESAHSPCFEEPEKMCRILREDVLMGKADLGD